MRALYRFALFLMFVALLWCAEIPLASLANVRQLENRNGDYSASEQALLRAGSGASLALQRGLNSDSLETRLRCARLMALRGDRAGDRALLEALRNHSTMNDQLGAMAEAMLLAVWNERRGPESAERDRLVRPRSKGSDAEIVKTLDQLLEKYPDWTAGYVQRGRIYQRNGEGLEAYRQAREALERDGEDFEAMVLLAQACLLLGRPEQAGVCLQQALTVNPRLKHAIREDIKDTLKAIDTERARRRQERRKDEPVI